MKSKSGLGLEITGIELGPYSMRPMDPVLP